MKVKICGITNKQNAIEVAKCGVDALGFVFYQQSKRYVTAEQLNWIKQLPSFTATVALFVNAEKDYINSIIKKLPIDILQFHGVETSDFCEQFNKRYIKAVPMQKLDKLQTLEYINSYNNCSAFLLDNFGKADIGGTGETFNWENIPETDSNIILAGGINKANIKCLLNKNNPYAIDLSSSIEISPGIKSIEKLRAILEQI